MSIDPDIESLAPSSPEGEPRELGSMDPRINSIQPGGGTCMAIELAWGRFRRWCLHRFRPGYVRRMRESRRGESGQYPHEILDPRDLKFYRNQGDLHWSAQDDPFTWRDKLPFVRVGLGEMVILGSGLLLITAILAWAYWPLAWLPIIPLMGLLWFFRDPRRRVPTEHGLVVSPADGRIFSVKEIDHDDYLGGPAVVIDIFLSVLNVHINRAPVECRVIGITYHPGKFLNALRPEAARENECLSVHIEETSAPYRGMRVRQITGAIARRIVCWVAPGEHLPKGGQFGMIKLGSRTELTLPKEPGLEVLAEEGQTVRAGTTVLARYAEDN